MDDLTNTPDADSSSRAADALRDQQQRWIQPLLDELDQAESARAWADVERLCKQILQRDGDNWSVWQRLAQAHEARQDLVQAETLWRHLTQRFSNRPEPYLALAALQRKRGTPDAARVVLEEAERKLGASDALKRSLAVIDDPWATGQAIPSLEPGASAAAVAQALQVAQAHLDHARFTEAEAVLMQILGVKPQAVRVHLALAQLRIRRQQRQELIDQLLPLYQPFPAEGPLSETLELPLLLLQTLQQEERHAEALALIEPLLQRWSSSLSLQHCALELLLARGEAARASQVLQMGLAQHPRDAVLHRLQGQLCLQLADPDSAVQALQQALALDPTDATTAEQLDAARHQQLWQRGEQALRQASWHEAEQAYRQLLERDPHQSDALRRLDLLASLNSDQLGTMNSTIRSSAGSDAQLERLLAFQHNLDRIEAQLKMLGCWF